jgi:hypothetical protein
MESKYDCLIKDLIILSSEKKTKLIGYGNMRTEMCINNGILAHNLAHFVSKIY